MGEIVEKVAAETGLAEKDIKAVIKAFLAEVQKGATVTGYFKSVVKDMPAVSKTRNVFGKEVKVEKPARKELKIKLAKGYKIVG